MTKIYKPALYFIIATAVVITGFDLYLLATKGTEGSISWTIYVWAYEYPVFSFAMGFLFGHLFWQMRKPKEIGKNV